MFYEGMHYTRFGEGPKIVIAVHGITASLMAWQAVATRLPSDWSLVAMDLRGRGHSADLPGPYGLPRHADDVLRLAEHVGAGRDAVLTGHSMGAYVAVLAGAQRAFSRVVLVDGGIPLPAFPPGTDVDAELEAALGPAIARLSQTFASPEEYVAFFKAHPAFVDAWTPEAEDYVLYDLTGPAGALRSRAVGEAVMEDGRWMRTHGSEIGAALRAVASPVSLLRAPRGLLNQPIGMLPDELAAEWTSVVEDELVPDCNHYTILFDDRCARVVASHLTR